MSNWFSDWLAGNGSGNASSSTDWGSTLDWVKFLSQYNQSQKSPVVRNVPQSPEQKQLFNFALGRVQGLPDSSQSVFPLAIKNAYTTPSFDIAAAKRGDVAYSHGTPDAAALARILAPQPNGGGGAPTPTGPTGGLPSGATGSPSQPSGAGGTFPGLGGYPGPMGGQPNTATNTSGAEFQNFVHTYGKAAGEAALALLQQNPLMGAKAAFDAVRAYFGSTPTASAGHPVDVGRVGNYTGNPNPTNAQWGTVDANGNYVPPAGAPKQRENMTPNYDPMSGAATIAALLGGQMGDDGSKTHHKF